MEFKQFIQKNKNLDLARIYTAQERWDSYCEYAKRLTGRKVSTGIEYVDNMIGMVRPAQVCTIIAPTNIGKTAFGLQCAFENAAELAKHNEIIIVGECEISQNEFFEREMQYRHDLWTSEIEDIFKSETLREQYKSIVKQHGNIITIIDRAKTNEIMLFIKAVEEITGKRCGLYILDYAGLTENQFKDEYARITHTMQYLKGAAQALDIPIVTFSQVPRSDSKDKGKWGLFSGKGSGEVENSSSIVCTLKSFKGELDKDDAKEFDRVLLDYPDIKDLVISEKPSHYLMKLVIEKKKQGNFGHTYLIFDKKKLKFEEIKPLF